MALSDKQAAVIEEIILQDSLINDPINTDIVGALGNHFQEIYDIVNLGIVDILGQIITLGVSVLSGVIALVFALRMLFHMTSLDPNKPVLKDLLGPVISMLIGIALFFSASSFVNFILLPIVNFIDYSAFWIVSKIDFSFSSSVESKASVINVADNQDIFSSLFKSLSMIFDIVHEKTGHFSWSIKNILILMILIVTVSFVLVTAFKLFIPIVAGKILFVLNVCMFPFVLLSFGGGSFEDAKKLAFGWLKNSLSYALWPFLGTLLLVIYVGILSYMIIVLGDGGGVAGAGRTPDPKITVGGAFSIMFTTGFLMTIFSYVSGSISQISSGVVNSASGGNSNALGGRESIGAGLVAGLGGVASGAVLGYQIANGMKNVFPNLSNRGGGDKDDKNDDLAGGREAWTGSLRNT